MTSEGLGELFEGDSADTCAGKFLLTPMGGRAEGLVCADPGARTPISVGGNLYTYNFVFIACDILQNKNKTIKKVLLILIERLM
jgi:hypothetical protein